MTDLSGSRSSAAIGRSAAPTAKIFVSDPDTEGVIRQALSDLGVNDAEFKKGTVETAIAELAKSTSPRLLIVDLDDLENPLSSMDALAARCEPDVNVIAIGARNDITLYRHLKNAGVTEYFFKPLSRDMVKRVLNSVLTGTEDQPRSQRSGKLVFVLGVRPGVGATTIATNLTWRLASSALSWVILVDMDLQNGDAGLQLDAQPSHALREAIDKPERVDKLFLERGTIHVTERLNLLASLEPLNETITPMNESVISLLEKLLQRYRYVFVDLPGTAAVGLTQILHLPCTCILVSNSSLASVRDLSRWRDCIGPNSPERQTLHVLNMSGADAGLTEDEFIRAVGHPPDYIIAYDRNIAMASKFGVKATQKCEVLVRGLGPLLSELAGKLSEKPRSIFSRIFG